MTDRGDLYTGGLGLAKKRKGCLSGRGGVAPQYRWRSSVSNIANWSGQGATGRGSCKADNYTATVEVTGLRDRRAGGRRGPGAAAGGQVLAGDAAGARPGASEPGLRLGDVDLDALGALGGRVLADGRGAPGGHQALAGLLALRALQRALPDQRRGALRRLLWHWRRGPSLLIKAEGSGHYTASQDKLGENWDRSVVRTHFFFFFKPKGG